VLLDCCEYLSALEITVRGEDLLKLPHKYSVLTVKEEIVVFFLSACEPSVLPSPLL
jgi:hypothetical protein